MSKEKESAASRVQAMIAKNKATNHKEEDIETKMRKAVKALSPEELGCVVYRYYIYSMYEERETWKSRNPKKLFRLDRRNSLGRILSKLTAVFRPDLKPKGGRSHD